MFASISQINQRIAADYGQEMLHTVVPQVPAVVEQYAPISLSEMASVALLNRTDTKFVMAAETLLAGLSQLQNDYRVLEIEGVRLHNYRTLYFDGRLHALLPPSRGGCGPLQGAFTRLP